MTAFVAKACFQHPFVLGFGRVSVVDETFRSLILVIIEPFIMVGAMCRATLKVSLGLPMYFFAGSF
jgi:trimethylamine:corrinoid methyltransferase-like protein